jgi:predicted secreted protein
MKAKKSLILIGLVAIVAIAAGTVIGVNLTSEKPMNKQAPSTVYISADANDTTVSVKKGETVNLTLQNYGDGGYLWTITPVDEKLLFQTNQFNWGSSGMLGDFGKDTWVFTAVQTGSTTLRLECARPFGEKDICQQFVVHLEITN